MIRHVINVRLGLHQFRPLRAIDSNHKRVRLGRAVKSRAGQKLSAYLQRGSAVNCAFFDIRQRQSNLSDDIKVYRILCHKDGASRAVKLSEPKRELRREMKTRSGIGLSDCWVATVSATVSHSRMCRDSWFQRFTSPRPYNLSTAIPALAPASRRERDDPRGRLAGRKRTGKDSPWP
jgi:hypothetical protein